MKGFSNIRAPKQQAALNNYQGILMPGNSSKTEPEQHTVKRVRRLSKYGMRLVFSGGLTSSCREPKSSDLTWYDF